MHPGPASHLRLARPSSDLAAADRFWVDGLGLEVLWRSDGEHDGHALLMVGWPSAAWHLELVHDPVVRPMPTEEDLLVLYLDGPVDDDVVQRLVDAGGAASRPATPTGTPGA
jgi:catechol 2,3-dioxygenase-like lactoylglutathione lyase family enzyme